MICTKCSGETVKARATNFGDEYDYCRTCKIEVEASAAPTDIAYGFRFKWDDVRKTLVPIGVEETSTPIIASTDQIKWDIKTVDVSKINWDYGLDTTDYLKYIKGEWGKV